MTRTSLAVERLINLHHLARTALSDLPHVPSKHERMLWAVREFVKQHPEYETPRAYIMLDCALG